MAVLAALRTGGPAPDNRNGTTAKTVLTGGGAVDLAVPRDATGRFDLLSQRLCRPYQRQFVTARRPQRRALDRRQSSLVV